MVSSEMVSGKNLMQRHRQSMTAFCPDKADFFSAKLPPSVLDCVDSWLR